MMAVFRFSVFSVRGFRTYREPSTGYKTGGDTMWQLQKETVKTFFVVFETIFVFYTWFTNLI